MIASSIKVERILQIEEKLASIALSRDTASSQEEFERLDSIHVAADRKRQGLIGSLTIEEHLDLELGRACR